jgi:hypothetical protein
MIKSIMSTYSKTMEYQFESPLKNNTPSRPKRFHSVEDNKYLKYKFAKETREKAISRDRWAKLRREDPIDEKLTRNEIWDNYINEMN